MRKIITLSHVAAMCSFGLIAAACGSDDVATPNDVTEVATASTTPSAASVVPGAVETAVATTEAPPETSPADVVLPTIVVTTNILGDIVTEAVGDLADVEVIMPVGADPHDFSPSARQAESMENADLLVVNGAGFEEGMTDIIELVESSGTPIFSFADHVELLAFDSDLEDEHSEDEHSEDEHSEGGDDPHIWTDPTNMIDGVEALGEALGALDGMEPADVQAQVQSYVDELTALDAEMEEILSTVPTENRVLVTNHEVFGYFAARFGFEVVGAVIPSLSTNAEPSTAEVEALVELVDREQIPAIFGDTSGTTRLAEAIASSAGSDVAVVVLFSESLGEPGSGADSYIGMMSTNATLISEALTPA